MAEGGVWRSTNGGSSWLPRTDSQASLTTGAVTIDRTNPSIVYAGTGVAGGFDNSLRGLSKGVGVYRSQDGGDTFAPTESSTSVLSGKNIVRMVLPSTGVLLVATDAGLYRSVDSGRTSAPTPLLSTTAARSSAAISPTST